MSPRFRLNPLAAAILATFTQPVLAQEETGQSAPDEIAAVTELPDVEVKGERSKGYASDSSTVGGKMPEPLRDIPQTVNVISRPVLDAQAATSIKDALRYVPGITISAGEGGQIGDNINLRGFSARTDVYLDGFRDRGQYSRDVFFLEAVEVLKGPASMLFGRGSTGGVINQVSKAPQRDAHYELSGTLGTDEYYRGTVDINQPLSESAAARVAIVGQDIQSTRDEIYQKNYGAAPSVRFGMGTPTDITLSALLLKGEELPDYGYPLLTENGPGTVASPIRARGDRFYGYTDDHFDQGVSVFNATVKHSVSPALTVRNRTHYAKYAIDASPTPLGTLTFADGTAGTPTQQTPLENINAARQNRDREIRDTALYNQTDLVASLRSGPVAHTLTGSLEVGVDDFRNDTFNWDPTNVPVNLGNPVNGTRQGNRTLATTTRTSADTLAVSVNEQADIGSQWKAVLGLRWESFRADSSAIAYNADGTLATTQPAQPPHNTDEMWSPRAGVIFQPTSEQSYYVSYGTSFNPSAEAVTQSVNNAALDPEKNRSYEVGAKYDLLGGNLQLNGALFRIEKTNARTTEVGSTVQALAGVVRMEGIELGAVGNLADTWQLVAGYTWLDSEILKSTTPGTGNNVGLTEVGKRFQNTPEHQAMLWSTYGFLQHFEVGAGVVYSSDRPVNNFETAFIDGYTRVDATAAFHQPRYDLRVNLQNATDDGDGYFETASGGRATPVRGRTVLFTGTVRLGKLKT